MIDQWRQKLDSKLLIIISYAPKNWRSGTRWTSKTKIWFSAPHAPYTYYTNLQWYHHLTVRHLHIIPHSSSTWTFVPTQHSASNQEDPTLNSSLIPIPHNYCFTSHQISSSLLAPTQSSKDTINEDFLTVLSEPIPNVKLSGKFLFISFYFKWLITENWVKTKHFMNISFRNSNKISDTHKRTHAYTHLVLAENLLLGNAWWRRQRPRKFVMIRFILLLSTVVSQ